jgi:two-component system OmpR family response regulator
MGEGVAIRVLIVDDDALTRDLVSRVLGAEAFEVAVASTAEQIAPVTRDFHPHAVLVDVNIPGVASGGAVAVVRSAAPAGARIVLFSADDEETLRATARRVQADGWLSKNTAVVDLGARIRKLLGS